MLPFLYVLVFQGQGESKLGSLSSSVGPIGALPELKGAKIISRSSYTLPGTTNSGRVFRYSLQGSLEGFLKVLKKQRSAKDGWKVEEQNAARIIFSCEDANAPLPMQSFVIQKARIVADPKGRVGIRVIKDAPGWIWVSYNEHIRAGK